jgi:DHA1 family inner membrane transport protein
MLTGVAHGVFFSIASTLATGLVPREKAAAAIATMFTGLTVALVTGVPLGTFIGQHFGWRQAFLVVAGLGAAAFLGSLLFVPRRLPHAAPASLAAQARVLAEPRLLLVYAMTAVGYGGSFIPFTFLAPILTEVAGLPSGTVGWVMLLYGVSVAAGNLWGGRLADRRGPIAALRIIFALLAAVLLLLQLAAPHAWLVPAVVLLWGAVAFGNVPGLQLYVVRQAQQVAPRGVDVASALNIAAFNLGIAAAAWLGGEIVARLGLMHTPWIGAIVVLLSLALTEWSGRLDRRAAAGPVRATVACP